MSRWKKIVSCGLVLCSITGLVVAQRGGMPRRGGGFGRGSGFGGGFGGGRGRQGLIDLATERKGIPSWENDEHFKSDLFTFVRIQYESRYRANAWMIDYPDSDLNFPFRLQQMTSLRVDPVAKHIRITDPELFDYPFIYMLEVGDLQFSEEEVTTLRKYLLNGGFLMVDDFWGEAEWANWYEQIKRVFPEREPVDLDISHPIFHCVFDLKSKPQIPAIEIAIANKYTGVTWEREDAKEPQYRAMFDDKGRMMAIFCHNTDLGDGWEREGQDEWFFHEFSEKKAYPMGINIVFYAMTH